MATMGKAVVAGLLLCMLLTEATAQITCAKLEKCIKIEEDKCDAHGMRRVCFIYNNGTDCTLATTVMAQLEGGCFEKDLKFCTAADRSCDPINMPLPENTRVCRNFEGGKYASIGILETAMMTTTLEEKDLHIDNKDVACSGFDDVCGNTNQEVRLKFKVKDCPKPKETCDCPWVPTTGSCDGSCGQGTRDFHKQCCTHLKKRESCSTNKQCPIHGRFSGWFVPVGAICEPQTVSCGGIGRQRLIRNCDSPAPKHGGNNCDGDTTTYQSCSLRPCPRPVIRRPRPTRKPRKPKRKRNRKRKPKRRRRKPKRNRRKPKKRRTRRN